jgi:hypothetical protein
VTRAVLADGVPASGKSSVARALGSSSPSRARARCGLLFDELGHHGAERAWSRSLGRASLGAIWACWRAFLPPRPWSWKPGSGCPRRKPEPGFLRGLERAHADGWVEIFDGVDVDAVSRWVREPLAWPRPGTWVGGATIVRT